MFSSVEFNKLSKSWLFPYHNYISAGESRKIIFPARAWLNHIENKLNNLRATRQAGAALALQETCLFVLRTSLLEEMR